LRRGLDSRHELVSDSAPGHIRFGFDAFFRRALQQCVDQPLNAFALGARDAVEIDP
jgi:hypothetical protein